MARKKLAYPVAKPHDDDVRVWLAANGYEECRQKIDALMERWRSQGLKTRRNWWDVLAGDHDGSPRSVDGIEFPVLRAARRRKLLPDVQTAICLSENEPIPPVRTSPRWPKKHKKR